MNQEMLDLKNRFDEICSTLKVRKNFPASPSDDGAAHVEFLDGVYMFVRTERGNKFQVRKSQSSDEVLYWLVSDIVFDLAIDYEKRDRDPKNDFRRGIFSKEVELMQEVSENWAARKRREIDEILAKSPYIDGK